MTATMSDAPTTGWSYERHFRRNLAAVAAWEVVWGFGQACVSSAIVLTFVAQLTSQKALIGALNITYLLALPGLLIAPYLNLGMRRKRLAVGGLHALQVAAWIVVGLATLVLAQQAETVLLIVVFVAHAYIYTVNGFLIAPTYELLSSVFGRRWGTAQGVQVFCNRIMGVLGGLTAATLLARLPFPQNFGFTFVIGGVCLVVSNLAVGLMIEPTVQGEGAAMHSSTARTNLAAHLANLGRLIGSHRALGFLLVVTGLLAIIQMVQGFYVVYAIERLRLDASYAGVFASVTFASNGLGGLVMGALGDRFGHRQLQAVSMAFYVVSFIAVLAMHSVEVFYVALALSAVATMGATIANINLACAFAPPGEKGAYAAITRLVTAPATALGMFASGLLIDVLGFVGVFSASLILPIIGLIATLLMAEPEAASKPVAQTE